MPKHQHRKSKEPFVEPPISPFASWEYQRIVAFVFGFFGLCSLIKSGIRPGPATPRHGTTGRSGLSAAV